MRGGIAVSIKLQQASGHAVKQLVQEPFKFTLDR